MDLPVRDRGSILFPVIKLTIDEKRRYGDLNRRLDLLEEKLER